MTRTASEAPPFPIGLDGPISRVEGYLAEWLDSRSLPSNLAQDALFRTRPGQAPAPRADPA